MATLTLDTLKTMTSAAILATPFHQLFEPSEEAITRRYRILIRPWAPDFNKDPAAHDVAAHLNVSREAADQAVKTGTWPRGKVIDFTQGTNHLEMEYRRSVDLGWASVYLSKASAVFVQAEGFKKVFDAALKNLREFSPPPGHPFATRSPFRIENIGTSGGVPAFRMVPLGPMARGYEGCRTNLLEDATRPVDPRAVGWILNRAFDWILAASRGSGGGVLIDVSPQTVLVDPTSHAILPLSGWGCAQKFGAPVLAVTPAFRMANPHYKKGDALTEADVLRVVQRFGRTLLGDPVGLKLPKPDSGVPAPMAAFLNADLTGKGLLEAWAQWKLALQEAYGPPKFVDWAPTFTLPE